MIRFGILGCSDIVTKSLLPYVNKTGKSVATSIASRDIDKARCFQERYNIKHCCTYEELLVSKDIDCVYISLPPAIQHIYAEEALKHGKHVLIEKPVSIFSKDYLNIAKYALKNNLYLMEAIMVKYHPWQKVVKSILEENKYGKLQEIISNISMIIPDRCLNGYRVKKNLGGGVFVDMAAYWLQFLQSIVGLEFKDINVDVKQWKNGVDFLTSIESMIDNVKIKFTSSFVDDYRATHVLKLEKATITVKDFFRPNLCKSKLKINIDEFENGSSNIVLEPENYYYNQLNHFISMVENNCDDLKEQITDTMLRIQYLETIRKLIYV